jgi:hypothetical protein
MKSNEKTGLELAYHLLQQEKDLKEQLRKLKIMTGKANNDDLKIRSIQFASDYVSSVHIYPDTQDETEIFSELSQHLLKEATKFIEGRLEGMSVLIGLADMAVRKALTDNNK